MMTKPLNTLSNLQQRIIAGLLGGSIIIASVFFSHWSYFFIFLIIQIFSQIEFYRLVGVDGWNPLKTFGTIIGTIIYSISFLIEIDFLPFESYFIVFPILSCIFLIALYKKEHLKPFTNIAYTVLGVVYIAVPFALLNHAAFNSGGYNYQLILGLLFLLWSSDSGAYFSGKRFGKTKLFERVSPKKTWEGTLGGTAAALVVALILSHYFTSVAIHDWLLMGLIIVVVGTYGDLVESLFKRSISIKDSGTFIPGHGGFLDRFDGLLLSAPFIAAYVRIFSI